MEYILRSIEQWSSRDGSKNLSHISDTDTGVSLILITKIQYSKSPANENKHVNKPAGSY